MMPPLPVGARRDAGLSSEWHCRGDAHARQLAHRARVPLALRVRALWKSYAAGVAGCSARVWVLRGASLHVAAGECVAVLGARGSGLTTLLHCLAGLRHADAGAIERGMEPLLIESDQLERASPRDDRLLLVHDASCLGDAAPHRGFIRERIARTQTSIIATHERARVWTVADRVVLLHHGRLLTLDRLTGARRVAEPGATEVTIE